MALMEYLDYRTLKQKQILEELGKINLDKPDWSRFFTNTDASTKYSIIIWYLKELVEKKEKGFLKEIFAIAKIYATDSDPSPEDDNINKKIGEGQEIPNIYTVRGTVCWLLSSIAATFKTEYYTDIISILEKLAFDPVYYVRIQATVPLSFFAANIRARRHKDETPFEFKDEDRQRVIDLSFRMLKEHRDMPRVLEGVVRVFEALRGLPEMQARQVIKTLFYNSKGELQPEYLTRQGVPLLIFFAEYRKNLLDDNFNGTWFQEFAYKLLKLPEDKAPYLRSTFIWHTWKELESNSKNYQELKKYIPLFMHEEFELQPLHQYDFLILQVLKASPEDGVELFQGLLNYIERWAYKYDISQHAWMLSAGNMVEAVAPVAPDKLIGFLTQITRIVSGGVWVGDIERMFKSYLLIGDEKQREQLRPEILKIYEDIRKFDRIGKLGDI